MQSDAVGSQVEFTLSGLLGQAGILATIGLLIGLVVLVLGLRTAVRRGPRRHAVALFAAAWLPLPLAALSNALGEMAGLREIVLLDPALTPKDLAYGAIHAKAAMAVGALGLLLGLSGAIAALARSRDDAA